MGRKATSRYAYEPDYAVPPGATLQETIRALGMTQKELAVRTGLTPKTVTGMINGKEPISHRTAVALQRVTGIPAQLWNNLETNYRARLARLDDAARLEDAAVWLRKSSIPVQELIKRGVMKRTTDRIERVRAVLRFFGVGDPQAWERLWLSPGAAFRKSPRFKAQPGPTATWLRLGELHAQEIECASYEADNFKAALERIRTLTTCDPHKFQPEMIDLCAGAGVALVFVPEIKGCPTSGAAWWLTPDKALIELSLRYKQDDHFWFSFFHEAGHILYDRKKEVFIDDGAADDDRERRANVFAARFLTPREWEAALPTLRTRGAIVRFASGLGIAPGIVVGRLQKDGVLPWRTNLNSLKRRLRWADE